MTVGRKVKIFISSKDGKFNSMLFDRSHEGSVTYKSRVIDVFGFNKNYIKVKVIVKKEI